MPNATAAKGATITIDGTAIGELTNISTPELSQEVIEVTTLADATPQKIANGIIAAGDVTISGNYYNSDTGQAALRTAVNGAAHTFIITLPNTGAETFTFSAIVTKFGNPESEKGGSLKFSATLAVTGAVTITA